MTGDVRGEQRVKPQFVAERLIVHFDFGVDQQNRQMRIRKHVFYQSVTTLGIGIRETIKGAIALGILDQMIEIAFFFVAKTFTVADEKLKIPRVWFVDVWVVNLVNDAVTEREPNAATGVIGCADAFLCT